MSQAITGSKRGNKRTRFVLARLTEACPGPTGRGGDGEKWTHLGYILVPYSLEIAEELDVTYERKRSKDAF